MKHTLYEIYFSNGYTDSISAFGPLDAGILAQAKAIRNARPKEIDSIRNEETGELHIYEAKVKKMSEV